jgi:hypothetical protein
MAVKRNTVDNVKADMEKRFPKEPEPGRPAKDKMLQLAFRMKESEYNKLMVLLDDEGKLFSQGVRSILRAYLKSKGAL